MKRIREATAADALALHNHIVSVFSERLPTLFDKPIFPSPDKIREQVEDAAASTDSVILIALDSGRVVGLLDFGRNHKPQRRHCGAFGISVRKEYRGRGVGTDLLRYLIKLVPHYGITRLELEVFSNNENAIRLYEQQGFVHEGRRSNAVKVGDEYVDIVMMVRTVEGEHFVPRQID